MDLNLDKLIGDLHEGISNVIRGHFSTVIADTEHEAQADASALVTEAAADLETIVTKLRTAIAPPATSTTEQQVAAGEPAASEGPPVGQPASS